MATKEQETGRGILENSELEKFFAVFNFGHRGPRFRNLAEAMLVADRPISIIETGCMRAPTVDPPEIDGCSSLVWNFIAEQTQGSFVSIDINPQNIEYAKSKLSPRAQLICGESVAILSSISRTQKPIDFLYLDSMDWEGTELDRGLSALHHAAELCAVWPWLNPGALIAIDDCHGAYAGKHAMVRRFFESINVAPICDDFIHVWRKPSPSPIVI